MLTKQRRELLSKLLVPGMALVTSVTMLVLHNARNNYLVWRWTGSALGLLVALAAFYASTHLHVFDERYQAWVAIYAKPEDGLLYRLLSLVPVTTQHAVIATAALSILNVVVVSPFFYRDVIDGYVMTIIMRFLADLPACWTICFAFGLAGSHLKEAE